MGAGTDRQETGGRAERRARLFAYLYPFGFDQHCQQSSVVAVVAVWQWHSGSVAV